MQELAIQLKSIDFWIFSVALAILFSVLGNYATRLLDRLFQLSATSVRTISARGRDARKAKLSHINDWVNVHENGAILVLSEAHFLCFLGITIIVLIISALILGRTELRAASGFFRVFIGVAAFGALILAMAAMNVGGMMLDAIRCHPKGLLHLYPMKAANQMSKHKGDIGSDR